MRREGLRAALVHRGPACGTLPTEAKVILYLDTHIEDTSDGSLLILLLRYHDGAWATVRSEAVFQGRLRGRDSCTLLVELAVDEDGGSEAGRLSFLRSLTLPARLACPVCRL